MAVSDPPLMRKTTDQQICMKNSHVEDWNRCSRLCVIDYFLLLAWHASCSFALRPNFLGGTGGGADASLAQMQLA